MSRLILLCNLVLAVALASPHPVGCSEPKDRVFFETKNSEAVECSVSLFLTFDQTIVWRTRDVKLMRELIVAPLTKAKADPSPAGYEIRGSLKIKRKDGSEVVYILFNPWGRIKRDDSYLVATLDGLPKTLKEALTRCLESLD